MPLELEMLNKIMEINVKNMNIESMKLTDKGIELSVYYGDKHLGDLVITNSKLIWCRGKTTPEKGKVVTWDKFIKTMQS
jgi:hypothetical protein